MQNRTQRLRPAGRRRGAMLVIAMMCLLLTSFLVVQVARLAVMTHERNHVAQESLQADWLADSAAARAVQRLQADPTYAGETWSIPASELGGANAGEVTIAVRPAEGADPDSDPDSNAGGRIVTITAVFPAGSPTAARQTKSFTLFALPGGGPAVAERPAP